MSRLQVSRATGKTHFIALFLVLFVILLLGGCTTSPGVGKATEMGTVSEISEIPEPIEEPCANVDKTQQEINSLAAGLPEAEAELDGLKIDFDFAQQDGVPTEEVEELIRNQDKYIADINTRITELQQSLITCDAS